MSLSWEQLGDKLISRAKFKKVPLIGAFELTSRCNLQCKMCYVCRPVNDETALAQERTTEEWINLARQARDAGLLYLLLTGGEIFLRSDFKRIYRELCNMGFSLQIYTNATMITPELAKWLGKIPPSKVGITLYGASSETYKKVCGSSSHFDSTLRGIQLLIEQGINVVLRTTVIKDNVQDFIKLAEIADKFGTQFKIVNYVSPRREGAGTCPLEVRLLPNELAEYEFNISNYFEVKNLEAEEEINLYETAIFSNEEPFLEEELNQLVGADESFACTAGSCYFWITSDGRMLPCGLMNWPSTMPFDKGFSNAWDELKALCSSIPACSECQQCSLKDYCMTCPARLKNETGEFDKPAPYLCELARNRERLYLRQKTSV